MTDPAQKADSTDARQASMSRVQTQETILAKLAPVSTASESSEVKTEEQQEKQEQGENSVKKSAAERISELANKRREAEAKAEAKERENAELKARLAALETAAPQIEQSNKPTRQSFASDEDYIEALTDWKAQDAIAKREQQQREAKMNAEAQQVDQAYSKRLESAIAEIDDFADVVGNSTAIIPDFLVMAIKESEAGPMLTYFLAKHPEEAAKLSSLRPVQAVKYLMELEKDLAEPTIKKPEPVKTPEKKRAPDPISPVNGTTTATAERPKDYESYRAQRLAKQGK